MPVIYLLTRQDVIDGATITLKFYFLSCYLLNTDQLSHNISLYLTVKLIDELIMPMSVIRAMNYIRMHSKKY